jgi:hypothetical protein
MKVLVCFMTHTGSEYYSNIWNTQLANFLANDDRFDVLLLEGKSSIEKTYSTGSVLYCPCEESYDNLNIKTYHMLEHAISKGYDYVIKLDDDIFLDDKISPAEFIKWFLIGDYSGLPIVKPHRVVVKLCSNNNDPLECANIFTYDDDGQISVMAGICYGISRRTMIKIIPILKENFLDMNCPEDIMLGESFNRVCDVNGFSRVYINMYIEHMCTYDTKGKRGVTDLTDIFMSQYKVAAKTREGLPKVTCICPTFGRTEDLKEAVFHFLSQNYANKELLVLNDNPNVHYIIPYDNVIVVNMNNTFKTLGHKRNWMVNAATGKYIIPWDDDDIHLPNRIESLVSGILGKVDKRYYSENGCYIWNNQNNSLAKVGLGRWHGGGYATNIFERHKARSVGGYTSVNRNEDSGLWKSLDRAGVNMDIQKNPPERSSYIIKSRTNNLQASSGLAMLTLHSEITDSGIITIVPTLSKTTENVIATLIDFINNNTLEEWDVVYPMSKEP